MFCKLFKFFYYLKLIWKRFLSMKKSLTNCCLLNWQDIFQLTVLNFNNCWLILQAGLFPCFYCFQVSLSSFNVCYICSIQLKVSKVRSNPFICLEERVSLANVHFKMLKHLSTKYWPHGVAKKIANLKFFYFFEIFWNFLIL